MMKPTLNFVSLSIFNLWCVRNLTIDWTQAKQFWRAWALNNNKDQRSLFGWFCKAYLICVAVRRPLLPSINYYVYTRDEGGKAGFLLAQLRGYHRCPLCGFWWFGNHLTFCSENSTLMQAATINYLKRDIFLRLLLKDKPGFLLTCACDDSSSE